MPEVIIQIGGRSFEVACQEGEEQFLLSGPSLHWLGEALAECRRLHALHAFREARYSFHQLMTNLPSFFKR
mgnify:CR=1 FL=1